MERLRIDLEGGRSWAAPGSEVGGRIVWVLDEPAESLEIRFLWYTEGRGTRDVGVVERRNLQGTGREGERSFRFVIPPGPYSFQGRLITLRWVVEAEARPGGAVVAEPLIVAPTPVPVDIRSGVAQGDRDLP